MSNAAIAIAQKTFRYTEKAETEHHAKLFLYQAICLMAERSGWKYKQAHQAIYPKVGKLRWFHRQKDCNDTEENKQKTKTETKFSNTQMRVLQKNIIILHLLVDSTLTEYVKNELNIFQELVL